MLDSSNTTCIQSLPKAQYKAMVSSTIKIDFDAKGIGAGQHERVSCEFLRVRVWQQVRPFSVSALSSISNVALRCGGSWYPR